MAAIRLSRQHPWQQTANVTAPGSSHGPGPRRARAAASEARLAAAELMLRHRAPTGQAAKQTRRTASLPKFFDLSHPSTSVPIGRVGSLRHDALQSYAARIVEHRRAVVRQMLNEAVDVLGPASKHGEAAPVRTRCVRSPPRAPRGPSVWPWVSNRAHAPRGSARPRAPGRRPMRPGETPSPPPWPFGFRSRLSRPWSL